VDPCRSWRRRAFVGDVAAGIAGATPVTWSHAGNKKSQACAWLFEIVGTINLLT